MAWAWVFVGAAFAAGELATVNGRPITEKDLESALGNLNEGQRRNVLKDQNTRMELVSNLIDQEVLAQQAEKEKLDQSDEFKDALALFRKQYLANRLLEKKLGPKMGDVEAKKYYENHKTEFTTDQVHAMHILLPTEEEARAVLKQAREPGADFPALAERMSKDPSAKNNRGDLGFFTRDRMVSEFSGAAFAGKAGEIVGPVKTGFGYHVIKIVEHKAGKALEFDEVEIRVRGALRDRLVRGLVSELRGQAKVEIKDKNLKAL